MPEALIAIGQPVVTSMGVASPFGAGYRALAEGMFNNESGVVGIEKLGVDPSFPIRAVGLLPDGVYPPLEMNQIDRECGDLLSTVLTDLFSRETHFVPVDCVIYGTNSGLPRMSDVLTFHHNRKSAGLPLDYGLGIIIDKLLRLGQPALHPSQMILCSNLCTTGLQAIGCAMQRIHLGLNQRILVVCDENRIRIEDLLRLNAIGALSQSQDSPETVSRPFSLSRSGFVKGEGAGALIIENAASSRARNAKEYAGLAGFGHTSDAWRLTDGREDAKGAVNAMKKALAQARVAAVQVDYVNAHGTATMKNDAIETRALKTVFGDHANQLAISSLKSQIGHLNFACGIVETIACIAMLENQTAAPTLNLMEPDPDCDLFYVPNKSVKMPIKVILKNSFGFGGANASLVLTHAAKQ